MHSLQQGREDFIVCGTATPTPERHVWHADCVFHDEWRKSNSSNKVHNRWRCKYCLRPKWHPYEQILLLLAQCTIKE